MIKGKILLLKVLLLTGIFSVLLTSNSWAADRGGNRHDDKGQNHHQTIYSTHHAGQTSHRDNKNRYYSSRGHDKYRGHSEYRADRSGHSSKRHYSSHNKHKYYSHYYRPHYYSRHNYRGHGYGHRAGHRYGRHYRNHDDNDAYLWLFGGLLLGEAIHYSRH